MKLFGMEIRRFDPDPHLRVAVPEVRSSIEDPTVKVSAENFLQFFGLNEGNLPRVTVDSALTVPAFLAGVGFLSRTMAALPLQVFRKGPDGAKKVENGVAPLLNSAPNPDTNSFKFRQYFWQQVFTGGRGLAWIERNGSKIVGIWQMDPTKTAIMRDGNGRIGYKFERKDPYPASEVIDIAFMLKANGWQHWGPVSRGARSLQLAIAMNNYGAAFFAGGGVPPLALKGPLASGPEAQGRAHADVLRAIENAKKDDKPIVPMPAGYELTTIGIDPSKGLMIEGQRFQVEESARLLGLPPIFVGDLTKGNFANTEQQDLNLVKHNITHWSIALEQELDLKLFGQRNNGLYVRHNLNALMRGDFKSRIEAMARGIQTAQLMPDEARELEERPPAKGGDKLYIQGATVPLGTQPVMTPPTPSDENDGEGK